MNEQDERVRRVYEIERDQANSFAKFYFNVRIGALSFFTIALGAITAFGWNYGFQHEYNDINIQTRFLRLSVLFLVFVLQVIAYCLETMFRTRYEIAWQVAMKYEQLLVGLGFHNLIHKSEIGLRGIARVMFIVIGEHSNPIFI